LGYEQGQSALQFSLLRENIFASIVMFFVQATGLAGSFFFETGQFHPESDQIRINGKSTFSRFISRYLCICYRW